MEVDALGCCGCVDVLGRPGGTRGVTLQQQQQQYKEYKERQLQGAAGGRGSENEGEAQQRQRQEGEEVPASSRKKAQVQPGLHKERMEKQMEVLQGKLMSIKETPRKHAGVYSAASGRRLSVMPVASTSAGSGAAAGGGMLEHADHHHQQQQQHKGMLLNTQYGGLAAKLESLKRGEKPVVVPKAEVGSGFDRMALSRSAQQLFGDEEFVALCEKGLTAKLSSSRDGATTEIKLRELADIVKTMRKALKEMQHRTQSFVEQSVKYERDAAHHTESIRLSAESSARAASADLANARREAATEAANHKAALASWQGEVDLHKSEAAALKREVERLEESHEALKESIAKIEHEKALLAGELHEIKSGESTREKKLQADKNAAAQSIYQAKEEFERQKEALTKSLQEAEDKVALGEEAQARLQTQLKKVEQEAEKMGAELKKTTLELESKSFDLEKAQSMLTSVQDEYDAIRKENAASSEDAASTRGKLEEWQRKAADLLHGLENEREITEKLRCTVQEYENRATTQESHLKDAKVQFEETLSAAKKREESLADEKKNLQEMIDSISEKYDEAQEKAETLMKELEEANTELKLTRESLDELKQKASSALQDVEKANERALKAEEKLISVEEEASEKVARLAQLEGELEALQECTMGLEGGDQKELLSRMVTKIATLEAAVVAAEAKRREAHNQLVELKGNIRVFCRVRPHPSGVAQCSADGGSIRVYADSKPFEFNFDRVFKPDVTQADVFDEVSDLVQSALDGYKVCLFSYGQTGAGKTFTMQGADTPGQEGIIPRSISKILKTVETLKEQGWEYKLEASFVEVYNEQLRDLLVEGREAGRITENNAIQHLPNGRSFLSNRSCDYHLL